MVENDSGHEKGHAPENAVMGSTLPGITPVKIAVWAWACLGQEEAF